MLRDPRFIAGVIVVLYLLAIFIITGSLSALLE